MAIEGLSIRLYGDHNFDSRFSVDLRREGFDIVLAALEGFSAAGGRVSASAAEAARGAEFVVTMLPAGTPVEVVEIRGATALVTD